MYLRKDEIELMLVKVAEYQGVPFTDESGYGNAIIDPLDHPFELYRAFQTLIDNALIDSPTQEILINMRKALESQTLIALITGIESFN